MARTIALSVGDITGIGPEVTLKALAAAPPGGDTRYLLFGDEEHLQALNARLGLNLKLQSEKSASTTAQFVVADSVSPTLPAQLERGAPAAASASVAWLEAGARRCLAGKADALVTAPVSKEMIIRAGYKFVGQTEYLSALAATTQTVMMLLGTDDRGRWLRVALATTHVPLKDVAATLSVPKVQLAIERAAEACRLLELTRARVAVCGLNPHAGEGGKIGDEEQTIISPAVEATRAKGVEVVGPLAADSLFFYALRGDYDAVVVMYHDQGLVPLKMVAFETGVNWTLGLPFVRTSPDHGTAYDIAGSGKANPSSMIAAIRLARQLCPESADVSGVIRSG